MNAMSSEELMRFSLLVLACCRTSSKITDVAYAFVFLHFTFRNSKYVSFQKVFYPVKQSCPQFSLFLIDAFIISVSTYDTFAISAMVETVDRRQWTFLAD